ncbi:hypothetical protein M1373_03640 [Candidatus Marsarchaeota archaeon]|nr:hypothetical protein [Candidatus Marsarchaeota archaeon]MCL5405012.1 hypothetical protein [Candidatus Marsarchaeota archaeon]
MSEVVYVFDRSDMDKLGKVLSYDPYLDKELLPDMPEELSDKKYLEQHPEAKEKAKELSERINKAKERLKNDPMLNTIFARQEYSLREGSSLGMDQSKCYLYIKASDDFIAKAEQKLKKEFASFAKADPETSQKVISFISEEQQRANEGFGSIFG